MSGVLSLIRDIKGTDNPVLKGAKLSFYISDGLKDQKLSIYEAYLLQQEVLHYTREGYILPACCTKVRIATCLALLNQRLLAQAFHDLNYAQLLKKWGMEAYGLCAEKRAHYIMDRYSDFMNIDRTCADDRNRGDRVWEELLGKLSDVRDNYDRLSGNDGPYHVEVFPYHYFEPERILLEKADPDKEEQISADTEAILIELSI